VEIGERYQGTTVILRPVGRIDPVTARQFQERLVKAVVAEDRDCIVDFSAVEFMTSAGLRALMTANAQKPKQRRFAVAGLTGVVSEVFQIAKFHFVVPRFETVEEALAWEPSQPQASAAPAARPAPRPQMPALGVRFWGTRGSLPAPLNARHVRQKLQAALRAAQGRRLDTPEAVDAFIDNELPFAMRGTFGGNTSCVEITGTGEEYVLCDLGSGVREFGNRVLAEHGAGRKHCYNFLQSHVHWDHIMGFPFFVPAYIPGNLIRIHGCHDTLEEAFNRQQSSPCFPVDFGSLGAKVEFVHLEPGRTVEIAGLSVTPMRQLHAGDSYGYRFERDGKTIVYSTDGEHKFEGRDDADRFVAFYRDADLLIFDAMYSLADAISVKEDWGHSSNVIAVELAQAARVKRLVLFHHEPAYDDGMISEVLRETVELAKLQQSGHGLEVVSAYDGLELTI
jgi:anti-anti-sigma factor